MSANRCARCHRVSPDAAVCSRCVATAERAQANIEKYGIPVGMWPEDQDAAVRQEALAECVNPDLAPLRDVYAEVLAQRTVIADQGQRLAQYDRLVGWLRDTAAGPPPGETDSTNPIERAYALRLLSRLEHG